jgi:hypothetical protein
MKTQNSGDGDGFCGVQKVINYHSSYGIVTTANSITASHPALTADFTILYAATLLIEQFGHSPASSAVT